jgi:hypothetical protein
MTAWVREGIPTEGSAPPTLPAGIPPHKEEGNTEPHLSRAGSG